MAKKTTIPSTYPSWIYDDSEIPDPFGYGERAVKFLRLLKHPKSVLPKKAFQLDPWQERVVRKIYGPRHEDGRRIVSTVVLLLPRGNRKTSLSAALALLHTIGPERVPMGNAIFAALDRKQAGIAFREARGIVKEDKRVDAACAIHDAFNAPKRIFYKKDSVELEVVSGDAGPQHGATPYFVLADEIHLWPNRLLWEALTTGLDKVDNSLLVVASTAGRGQDTLAWDVVDSARKVARGEVDDPSMLPILFEADRNCDWRDETLWHKVNPGLRHGYPSLDGFRKHARRAERSIGERNSLLQLKLNAWLDQAMDPFVDMGVYDAGKMEPDLEALEEVPCWLGVDLSSVIDLSVVVACWRTAEGYVVKPWFFCPRDNLQEREDEAGVSYVEWEAEGEIEATDGNVISYATIAERIEEICARFNVKEIAMDPRMAEPVRQPLLDKGLPVVDFGQSTKLLMPAYHEMERAILGNEFHHGAHPVLRHCFANVRVRRNDLDQVTRFTKPKNTKWLSIDGAVAAAMAVARCSRGEGGSITDSDWFTDDMYTA
ncbi:terminase TerL endonuclease subunit [Devosia sp.]|uniref:terminase large subunit n=1 Tax=Devosia sp. TaxID=1871048 RepID=UPI001AD596C1|nr:terminase TerL endonuclease subunit [Devosia sp.]MBN9335383.1 terminase large subunit [Devosia sp.]